MYSYRLKGGVLLLAGIETVWISLFLVAVEKVHMAAWQESGAGLIGQMVLPWILGITAEALWRMLAKHPMSNSMQSACTRSMGAAIVPGLLWLSWSNMMGRLLWLGEIWILCLLMLIVLHWGLTDGILRLFFSGQHHQRALLVGEPSQAARLQSTLQAHRNLGILPVGWLISHGDQDEPVGVPHWGHAGELETIVKRESVQQVILAGMPPNGICPSALASTCERLGVRLTVAHELGVGISKSVQWETNGDWCLGAFYREPLQSPLNRCLKRGLDLLVAIPAVLLLLVPLACLTWMMQRLQSRGPLFCRQWRHGRSNQVFQIWKFRSMHPQSGNVAQQATRTDSRVYSFGRILRRHSLDELPQFLNVLLGEMSVVGPRPHLTEHTAEFSIQGRYHIRSFVKPGITGLAQVNGCRGELHRPEDLRRRVDWDIRYVENWSLLLDFNVMVRTVSEIVRPSGAAY